MAVQWTDPRVAAVYEDMIAVLIKRLHPDAVHVDGSGGDEGRDVQVPTADGLVIYELKSFSSRLNQGGRKDQVRRSLTRAAEHRPVSWRLVAPINLTPGELRWFDALVASCDFPCEWRGRTWLNSELAQRPDITRYFLDDHRAEVYELISQLGAERSEFEDIPGALLRVESIQQRLNNINPYFHFVVGHVSQGQAQGSVHTKYFGNQRIDVVPKYATALQDHPLAIYAEFEFDRSTQHLRQQFERSLDYGEPVELPAEVVRRFAVDAPAGLSTEFTEIPLALMGERSTLPDGSTVHATIYSPERERLATLEFVLSHRTGGRVGTTVYGQDESRLVSLSIRLRPDDRTIDASFSFQRKPVLPAVGLPVARWLEQMRPPHVAQLEFVSPAAGAAETEIADAIEPDGLREVYEAFATLQEHCGVTFPVPDDLNAEEWREVARVARWLSPEKREFRWSETSFKMYGDAPQHLVDTLLNPNGGFIFTRQGTTWEFRNRQLDLGQLARTFGPVVASNPDEVRAGRARGDAEVEVVIAPKNSDVGYEWLLRRGDPLLEA